MSEQQTSTETITTTQAKMLPSIIEWGSSFLLILACVAVGSIAIYFSLSLFGLIIGGFIGGIIVGFMPYITQRWRIFRMGWQAAIFANLIIIIGSFTLSGYYLYQEAITAQTLLTANGISTTTLDSQVEFRLSSLFIFVGLGSITGVIVGVITRWVCQRWLKSQASWWVWTLGAVLIIVVLFFNLFLAVLMLFGQ
jgi:hypothetical protein